MAKTRFSIPTQPHAIEREYWRFIMMYQSVYEKMTRQGLEALIPKLRRESAHEHPDNRVGTEHFDANIDDEVGRLFSGVQGRLEAMFPNSVIEGWIRRIVRSTKGLAAKNLANQYRQATKWHPKGEVNIEPLLLADKKLNPYFNNVIEQNVGLIRSISKERMVPLKNALVDAITRDLPATELSKMISKSFGMTKNKAMLIAVDQVGKMNGALDKYHQQTLGGKKYTWRTMGDGAVRPDHKKLNGKAFYWSRPPIINKSTGARGNPKEDIRCRCYAEMDLSEVFD